jgi:tetratricopeptide (TPR) repeat protein
MSTYAPIENQIQDELLSLPLDPEVLDIEEQLKADPTNPQLWMERGIALKKQHRNFRLAIDSYSTGLTYDPFYSLLYRHRGHAYVNIRRYREAAADFEMALRLDPSNWDSWYHLGLSYHLLGEFERALPVYENCLAISQNNADLLIAATDWYCMTLMKLGRLDEMKAAASRVTPDMSLTKEGDGYFQRVLVYNGSRMLEDVYQEGLAKDDHMFCTTVYGLAVYAEYALGDKTRANAILGEIVNNKSTLWAGFAEHAAYEDLKKSN